jgi:hypothetical protein
MLHQVMLTGNIKKGNSPIIKQDHAQRIVDHAFERSYKGFTVYIDGNYTTLYEGKLEQIEKTIAYYADSETYSKITTMVSRPVENHMFEDFHLYLRNIDCDNVIGTVANCVTLTPDYFQNLMPENMRPEYKSLLKTFARVNNMVLLENAA